MLEEGKVVSVAAGEQNAQVVMESSERCRGCAACLDNGGNRRPILARNLVQARPGDRVQVRIDAWSRIMSSLLIFLLPLIFFWVGYILCTSLFTWEEGLAALGGLALAGGYYGILAAVDRMRRRRGLLSIEIVAVLRSTTTNSSGS